MLVMNLRYFILCELTLIMNFRLLSLAELYLAVVSSW